MPLNLWGRVTTMTRETRLGLVVSCSFLGLLGAVLALKVSEAGEGTPQPEVAAAGPQEPAGNPTPPGPAPGETGHHEDAPSAEDGKTPPSPLPPNVAKQSSPIRQTGGVTTSPGPGSPGSATGTNGKTGTEEVDLSALPGLPPPAGDKPTPIAAAPSSPARGTNDGDGFWSRVVALARLQAAVLAARASQGTASGNAGTRGKAH